jgi:hypothetical protein
VKSGVQPKLFVMKKIYSLLFPFLIVASASAKTTSVTIPNMFPNYGPGYIGQGVVTSRIIGYAHLKHNGTSFIPVDSTTYSYTFGRGGVLNQEEMDDNFVRFDESYTYRYDPLLGYVNRYHRFQSFNSVNDAKIYTYQNWNTENNAWTDSARLLYTYSGTPAILVKTMFQIWYNHMWTDHVEYDNLYDNNGLRRMASLIYRMYFNYDNNGNVIEREDSSYSLSTFSWHKSQRLLFTYNITNNLSSYIVQQWTSGNWVNDEKYEYVLNGASIAEIIVYNWDNNNWEFSGKDVFSYDANQNKTSDEWQYWDEASSSFKSASREVWTYDSYNQPLTYRSETYEPSTSSWASTTDDFLYRYYYQAFNPASVPDVMDKDISLKLFPQPANNALTVEIGKDMSNYTISVLDIYGKEIRHINAHSKSNVIDVANLSSGIYFVRINSQIARQFVVAH